MLFREWFSRLGVRFLLGKKIQGGEGGKKKKTDEPGLEPGTTNLAGRV